MKQLLFIILVLSIPFFSNASTKCKPQYMHDPCEIDGYTLIEIEKFVPGRHNWMNDVHNFTSTIVKKPKHKYRKKRIKQTQKHTKYIKKCHLVRVK